MEKPRDNKSIGRAIIIAAVLLALMIAATALLMPYIRRLTDPAVQVRFRNWLNTLGVWGYVVIILIQITQIVIAFIPGEIVEILAGVTYGGFGGLVLCLIGCVIASSGIFLLSKKLGAAFMQRLFCKERLAKFSFLQDTKKLELVVFILFLIPGTPKDMLTYVAGTTPMKVFRFLVISTFARIPSILSSTLIGFFLRSGNWAILILMFSLTALIGVFGILYRDKIIAYYKKLSAHGSEENARTEDRAEE